MRIIAGQARGRKLATLPRGRSIRPTTDRVRESLFGILQSRMSLQGVQVLDVFAGTGALGCEALSRGAASATFVDQSRVSFKTILENLRRIDRPGEEILIGDAAAILRKIKPSKPFDLVFLDPPYNRDLIGPVMQTIDKSQLLAPDALVIVEHDPKEPLPEDLLTLQHLQTRSYGDTRLSLWEHATDQDTP